MRRSRRIALGALSLYVVFLGVILLDASPELPNEAVWQLTRLGVGAGLPVSQFTPVRVEFLTNVAIIFPVVILGSLVWPRMNYRDWTAIGFVLSSAVELLQALILPHRSATFADIVANTLGACLGGLTAALVRRWHYRRPSFLCE